jgi:hypothetical protein
MICHKVEFLLSRHRVDDHFQSHQINHLEVDHHNLLRRLPLATPDHHHLLHPRHQHLTQVLHRRPRLQVRQDHLVNRASRSPITSIIQCRILMKDQS